jgi:hypothetical protein
MAAVAFARADAATADDPVARALAKPADGYIVELTVTRDGQSSYVGTYSAEDVQSADHQWRYGAMRVRVHIVNWTLGTDAWNPVDAMVALEGWSESVDRELAQIQAVRQMGEDPLANPMLAFADEDERIVRAAAARAEDVRALLRLLHGIQYYRQVRDNGGDASQPVSAVPVISFEGGEIFVRSRSSQYGESAATQAVPALAPDDELMPHLQSETQYISLVAWRFDPADMARAQELAASAAAIADELTYRAENVDADLIDSRIGFTWENRAEMLQPVFRDAFMSGLREVVRGAWALAPQAPPDGLFAEGPRAQGWLGELAPDAPLSLPEISGDRLIRLILPAGGLNEGPYYLMTGQRRTSSPTEFDWFYRFPVGNFGDQRSDKVSIRISPSPGTDVRYGFWHPHVTWEVDGDVSGDRVEGSFSHLAEVQYTQIASATDKREGEARDEVRVQWAILYEPAPASPAEEPMTLSFARPTDGKPVPFEGPADYGDAFYVEGRLEKPATREVYRIALQTPDGTPQDVFLRPTAEDPTLLRSEILYVMWDVTKQEQPQ